MRIINFFKPWRYTVIRFVGTERSNCDSMIKVIQQPSVVPISYQTILVEKRYISTLIIKHKNKLTTNDKA